MVKSCPFLIRNLPNDKAIIARQELKIKQLEEDVDFYKSILRKNNSAIFNLKIKTIHGERIWYDKVFDYMTLLHQLDEDDEVIEWKKPIRCER